MFSDPSGSNIITFSILQLVYYTGDIMVDIAQLGNYTQDITWKLYIAEFNMEDIKEAGYLISNISTKIV